MIVYKIYKSHISYTTIVIYKLLHFTKALWKSHIYLSQKCFVGFYLCKYLLIGVSDFVVEFSWIEQPTY